MSDLTKLILIIIMWVFIMFSIANVHAQEFGVFDTTPIAERHRIAAVSAFAVSMTGYAAGLQPEYAAPLGFVVTALAENYQHNGRHGMTASEYRMIAFGAGVSYIVEKGFQKMGWHSPLRWEF